jgi:hypothetical protein
VKIEDVAIREERRLFEVEKMDYVEKQHLEGS